MTEPVKIRLECGELKGDVTVDEARELYQGLKARFEVSHPLTEYFADDEEDILRDLDLTTRRHFCDMFVRF